MSLTLEQRRLLARDALTGLSTADAFGNQAFPDPLRVISPDFPESWAWTDDTHMACSLVDILERHAGVDRDALAAAFAERAERFREYGTGAMKLLGRVRDGDDWRLVTPGMFHGGGSWGNGGAMRVGPVGAWFSDDLKRAATESAASAEVTHAHPEGIAGGIAVGVAAAHAASLRGQEFPGRSLIEVVLEHVPASLVRDGLTRALEIFDVAPPEAAAELGNGSKASAQDTVPFALWAVATRREYESAVRTCVEAGGDMDTTAAIAGGIIAAQQGPGCVPDAWLLVREPLPAWLQAQ